MARDTVILFDANAARNQKVRAARHVLAKELVGRGARVRIAELPVEVNVNGPDDYIAKHGDTLFFGLIDAATSTERSPHSVKPDGIDASDRDLPRAASAAWSALQAANDPPRLFRHGELPIRLDHDEHGGPVLTQLTRERLRHELARAKPWFVTTKKRDVKGAAPPMVVIEDMLAGSNLPLPLLRAVSHTPVFTRDEWVTRSRVPPRVWNSRRPAGHRLFLTFRCTRRARTSTRPDG